MIICVMLLLATGLQAQRVMSFDKAKKAGLVVLLDKHTDPLCTEGHMVVIQMNDKSRPSKTRKNSILITEIDLSNKTQEKHTLPIKKGELELEEDEISVVNTNDQGFTLDIKNGSLFLGLFELDKPTLRQYEIVNAIFYAEYADFLLGNKILGEERDINSAFKYISKMLESYK